MEQEEVYIGIDVAKTHVDVAVRPHWPEVDHLQ